jgi:hypothetical protein
MRRKTVWLGLLTAAVVVLSTGLATAAPTTGERALSASELSGTFGACCSDDYIDSQTCSKTNDWPCYSCMLGPAECGFGREHSGNIIEQCTDGTGGICKFTVAVDCYRHISCNKTTHAFYYCNVEGGGPCDLSLSSNCTQCTGGAAGPWITRDSYICDE